MSRDEFKDPVHVQILRYPLHLIKWHMELLSFYICIYLPFAPLQVQFTQKCSKATGTPMVKGLIDMLILDLTISKPLTSSCLTDLDPPLVSVSIDLHLPGRPWPYSFLYHQWPPYVLLTLTLLSTTSFFRLLNSRFRNMACLAVYFRSGSSIFLYRAT